jgi:hypothetical protein
MCLQMASFAYTSQVTQHFQKLHGQAGYREIEALDADLKKLVADLPPTFRMLNPDKSYDSSHTWTDSRRTVVPTDSPILHPDRDLAFHYNPTPSLALAQAPKQPLCAIAQRVFRGSRDGS